MSRAMTATILDFDTHELMGVYSNKNKVAFPKEKQAALHAARLNAVLQTTIELSEILQIYYQEISSLLKIEGLSYEHKANNYVFVLGNNGGHSSHYVLQTKEDYLGELSFHRTTEKFSKQELKLIEDLIASLVYPLRNGLRYQEAIRSALTDALTGAGNRICLDNVLAREFELSQRYQQPLSILMLDIDFFKKVNDNFGHAAGDKVLRIVADTIKSTSRCADMTFRYGGEEFVVLLNKTDLPGAMISAERLRATIAGLSCIYENQEIPITISVGVATLNNGEPKEQLLKRADEALYRAKQSGRNQIKAAQTELVLNTDQI
ncbi:MAG: GGDEF domain-containing protein [Pseudomonadales bacterium]|nr:GGDEF domain-containing protein [Pseudomonadales bacterium]